MGTSYTGKRSYERGPDRKTVHVTFTCTEREARILKEQAFWSDMTRAEYIRKKLFSQQ